MSKSKKKKKWAQSSLKSRPLSSSLPSEASRQIKQASSDSGVFAASTGVLGGGKPRARSPEEIKAIHDDYCEEMTSSFQSYFNQRPGMLFMVGIQRNPILTNLHSEGATEATPKMVHDFLANIGEDSAQSLKYVVHRAGAIFIFGHGLVHREAAMIAARLGDWQVRNHTDAAGFLRRDDNGAIYSSGESISIGAKADRSGSDAAYINRLVANHAKRAADPEAPLEL